MKTLLLPLVLCALLVSPALARVGETKAECEARYGKPAKTEKYLSFDLYLYVKSGFVIAVMFDAERAGTVQYQHETGEEIIAPEITDAELEALLKANAGGSSWIEDKGVIAKRSWKRADGVLMARYNPLDRTLLMGDVEFGKKLVAAQGSSEAEKIKGL